MRIQLIVPPATTLSREAIGFVEGMKEAFGKAAFQVELVDKHPDLIHVVGIRNEVSMQAITKAHSRQIPVACSPLGELTPWNLQQHLARTQAPNLKNALQSANLIHVTGPFEQKTVEEIARKHGRTILAPNPVVTNASTFEHVAQILVEEYIQLIQKQEDAKRMEIKKLLVGESDEVASSLYEKILYLRYMNQRQTLPLLLLHELAALLTQSDYDENAFSKNLKRYAIEGFFPRLEQILAEQSSLTEGFMPLPPVDDRETERMRKYVFVQE